MERSCTGTSSPEGYLAKEESGIRLELKETSRRRRSRSIDAAARCQQAASKQLKGSVVIRAPSVYIYFS
jgi:hypothetical protein